MRCRICALIANPHGHGIRPHQAQGTVTKSMSFSDAPSSAGSRSRHVRTVERQPLFPAHGCRWFPRAANRGSRWVPCLISIPRGTSGQRFEADASAHSLLAGDVEACPRRQPRLGHSARDGSAMIPSSLNHVVNEDAPRAVSVAEAQGRPGSCRRLRLIFPGRPSHTCCTGIMASSTQIRERLAKPWGRSMQGRTNRSS